MLPARDRFTASCTLRTIPTFVTRSARRAFRTNLRTSAPKQISMIEIGSWPKTKANLSELAECDIRVQKRKRVLAYVGDNKWKLIRTELSNRRISLRREMMNGVRLRTRAKAIAKCAIAASTRGEGSLINALRVPFIACEQPLHS